MAEIIGIRFKREGKQYYFDPQGMEIKPGMGVVLETSWGVEFGECVRGNSIIPDEELVAPLRSILRMATEEDFEVVRKNRVKEKDAFAVCQKKIEDHSLDMKLVDVEMGFEGNKILFFFTSEGRVDFRALVKDLAAIFHSRIELRQIGVRDEAKMLGGLGICGRPFCCSSFLREFQPVSIKMAKTQNLSLNPTKISGTCGRLMCCLKYEQEAYEDLLRYSPKSDSFVETPDGVGDIINVNLLRERVRVRLDSAPDTVKIYHNSEIRVIRSGKGKRPEDYQIPTAQELEKLRRVQEEVLRPESALHSTSPLRQFSAVPETQAKPQPQKEERRPAGKGRQNARPHGQGQPPQRKEQKQQPSAGQSGVKTEAEQSKIQQGEPRLQNRRQNKSAAQAAIEKALPQENSPAPKDAGAEKKPPRRPYWRKKPGKPTQKKKEGGE